MRGWSTGSIAGSWLSICAPTGAKRGLQGGWLGAEGGEDDGVPVKKLG